MFISALDLVSLHRSRVDPVNNEHKMVSVLLVRYDVEVACKFITMKVASDSDKLALSLIVLVLKKVVRVVLPLLNKFLCLLVPFCGGQVMVGCLGSLRLNHLVRNSGLKILWMLDCLRSFYAMRSGKLPHILWLGIPEKKKHR